MRNRNSAFRPVVVPLLKSRLSRLAPCLLINVALQGPASLAAVAPMADDELDEIQVTATRIPRAAFDVSPSVTVLVDEELKRISPLTVVDHMRGEPGTYVQQTTPGQGIVIVRGLKGSEVLHIVDGFRLNNTIFRNAPNQYLALLNPWNIERIEVVKGPMGALHGGDAMGGVVHFSTRSPNFDGESRSSRVQLGSQFETVNDSRAVHAEGELGNRHWLVHVGGAWQDVGELRVGEGDELPYTAFGFRAANMRLHFVPVRGHELQLQAQWSEQPETPRHDALVPGFGQVTPDSAEHLFNPQQRSFAQLRYSSALHSAGADKVEVQFGYQQIVDDRTTRDFGTTVRDREHNSSNLWGSSAQLSKAIGATHSLVYGIEVYRDEVRSIGQRIDLATGTEMDRPSRFPDGSSQRWIAAYAQDTWRLTPEFDLTAAARYTAYETTLASTEAADSVQTRPSDWSWNLGALFRASEVLHLAANVGRGFRPPNIFDLGTLGPRQNRFNIPNPDLDPESVFTADVGFKLRGVRWESELFAFVSDYRDKITQVLTGDVDPAGRLIVQSQNATDLELRGIEAATAFRPNERMRIRATATWTKGDEKLAGERYPADRIPPAFGLFDIRYALQPGWDVALRVDWAASQRRLSPRDLVDPRINPAGSASWTSLSLRMRWQATARWTMALDFDNLLDHRYREHGSGFDAPGRGLTLRLELGL